ncbi:MAG: hypothetical protein V3U02_05155 [Calditrichia bacterium]
MNSKVKSKIINNENIVTNMSSEEISIWFSSGLHNIPHEGYARCKAIKTKKQKIPIGRNWVNITWGDEEYNNKGMHNISHHNDWIMSKSDGVYDISYQIEIEVHGKSTTRIQVNKNGNMDIPRSVVCLYSKPKSKELIKIPNIITLCGRIPLIRLFDKEYIVVQANHDSEKEQNIITANSYFFCERRY